MVLVVVAVVIMVNVLFWVEFWFYFLLLLLLLLLLIVFCFSSSIHLLPRSHIDRMKAADLVEEDKPADVPEAETDPEPSKETQPDTESNSGASLASCVFIILAPASGSLIQLLSML